MRTEVLRNDHGHFSESHRSGDDAFYYPNRDRKWEHEEAHYRYQVVATGARSGCLGNWGLSVTQ